MAKIVNPFILYMKKSEPTPTPTPTKTTKTIKVIDYDGTVLKTAELDAGSTFELPSEPTHDGLTFQSWASPIEIVNNTITVGDSDITIGATYTTASETCEFDITLTTVTGLTFTLNIEGTKVWGDGTTDTATSHTYTEAGDYTVYCYPTNTALPANMFGQSNSNINYTVTRVRLSNSVTSIGSETFSYCYSLTSITIPQGVTSIGSYAFSGCTSLTSITIPQGVTSIGSSAFSYCYSLTSITIPQGVTSIGDNAFSPCYSIITYDFSDYASVPTLSSVNAFNSINKICKMLIPEALIDTWKTATNWATYADYMVAV